MNPRRVSIPPRWSDFKPKAPRTVEEVTAAVAADLAESGRDVSRAGLIAAGLRRVHDQYNGSYHSRKCPYCPIGMEPPEDDPEDDE